MRFPFRFIMLSFYSRLLLPIEYLLVIIFCTSDMVLQVAIDLFVPFTTRNEGFVAHLIYLSALLNQSSINRPCDLCERRRVRESPICDLTASLASLALGHCRTSPSSQAREARVAVKLARLARSERDVIRVVREADLCKRGHVRESPICVREAVCERGRAL